MKSRIDIKNGLLTVALFAVCAFVSLWYMAPGTSPAIPQTMYDVGIFRTIGKCWADGGVPYVDIFDQKGPILYMIYAFAALIGPSKWPIFIIECLTLTLSASLFYKTGTTLGCSKCNSRAASVIMLFAAVLLCGMGGTVEEFSLPFELLPLWLTARCLKDNSRPLLRYSFFTGICFGCVSLIRINNNAVIVGICLTLAFILVKQKEFKLLIKISLSFLAGLIVALLPLFIYFAANGALFAMLDSVFHTGWLYKLYWDVKYPTIQFIIIYSASFFSLVAACYFAKGKSSRIVMLGLGVGFMINVIFNIGGAYYLHYAVMLVPFLAVMCFFFKWGKWYIYILPIILCGTEFLVDNEDIVNRLRSVRYADPIQDPMIDCLSFIPLDEQCSIYVCGSIDSADIPLSLGYLPAGKYFFQQYSYGRLSKSLYNDIINDFRRTSPLWVISEAEDSEGSLAMLKPYMSDYELVTVTREQVIPYRSEMAVYRKITAAGE